MQRFKMTSCRTRQLMVMGRERKVILSEQKENTQQSRHLGQETKRRKQVILQGPQSESRILIEDKEIEGISMESRHLLLPQRHTSRVTMYIVSRLGVHMSLPPGQTDSSTLSTSKGQPSRQSQPGYWSSSSKWQSSAGDDGSWKKVSDWEGSQWSAPTRRTLKGSDYEMDQEWQLRICDMVRVGHVTLLKAIAREQSRLTPILKMIV